MKRFSSDQSGQMIVLVAAMVLTLLMFVGLAIDAGQLYVARRTMQEAADAGAYAGAVVLYQNASADVPLSTSDAETLAVAAARNDATLNGFTNGVDGATVTVSLPPTSGSFALNRLYVQVTIQQNVRTTLVPAQAALTSVTVRATAGSEPLNNDYAVMALERGNVSGALNISANGHVDLIGGGVLSNSTHATGAALTDTNDINYACPALDPCYTDVNGGAGGTGTWPNVRTGRPQEPDPFAGFPKPSIPACASGGITTCLFNATPNGNPIVLEPGVYTSRISESGNKQIIFKPGVYILKAGMSFSGQAEALSQDGTTTPACLASCGVFLFNTTSNYPAAGGTCGDVDLSGNGATRFNAMTTGTYAGFLYYQDSACTVPINIGGNGFFNGTGTIYLPNASFVLNGNNATLTGSQIVAKQVNIQNGNLSINFTTANTAQPILPRLAE